jgi:hypothetical protein
MASQQEDCAVALSKTLSLFHENKLFDDYLPYDNKRWSRTPSTAALLFEIREQHRKCTGYKYRYCQTDDMVKKAMFVREWKKVQESKCHLKVAYRLVWMRTHFTKTDIDT